MPGNAPWSGGSSPGADRPSVDGNWTFASPVAEPEISFPFDTDSKAAAVNNFTYSPELDGYISTPPDAAQNNLRAACFIIEQDFQIAADFFTPLPLDTVYDTAQYAPDFESELPIDEAILIGESVPRNLGNGVVQWTRTYCRMPDVGAAGVFSRNVYESDTFSFPGIGDPTAGRPTMNAREVTARVQKDYFLAPAGDFSPNLFDSTLPNFIFQKFTIYGEFIWQEREAIQDPTADDPGTSPPEHDNPDTGEQGYLTAIDNGWEIVIRQSVIRPWRGNIYERTTYYAVAQ